MSDTVSEHRAHMKRVGLIERSIAKVVCADAFQMDDRVTKRAPSCPIPINGTDTVEGSRAHVFRHRGIYHRCAMCGSQIESVTMHAAHGSADALQPENDEPTAVWFPSLGDNAWVTMCGACTASKSPHRRKPFWTLSCTFFLGGHHDQRGTAHTGPGLYGL